MARNTNRLQLTLLDNDRRGERAIAAFQSIMAIIVIVFHLIAAQKNHWDSFSGIVISIAVAILLFSLLRLRLSNAKSLPNILLNGLTVLDGALIFLLIGSYSWAYNLPIETSFKAPSLIFLVAYICVRALKPDPVPVLIAGSTVLIGWIGLLLFVIQSEAVRASSYPEFIASGKVLVDAQIEMAVGFSAVIMILALATSYARENLANSASLEELKHANLKAEIATRAKSQFLAMMSHEIRTPLNGMLGILTLLSGTFKQDEYAKLITMARQSGKELLAIINDILDFSDIEAGKLKLEIIPFRTVMILDTVQSLICQQGNSKSLKLTFETDQDVPDVLIGDPDRIRQVLFNLVNNAVKFTETGYVRVAVKNIGTSSGPLLRFSVEDTGIGVPLEIQSELFAEFATIDASYARKFGGTGLGLSISKALTKAMDGEIGFSSVAGSGSTFWFELPLPQGNPASTFDEDGPENTHALQVGLDELRILLAEDNVTNQLVVGNILERFGCSVDTVSNGQEAIDSVLARAYDAILMDISMPVMDGITATKKIRHLDGCAGSTPIIALTAYAHDEDRQRILAAGMNDFVAKPVSTIKLARALGRQTGQYGNPSPAHEQEFKGQFALFDHVVLGGVLADMDSSLRTRVLLEFKNDVEKHLSNLKMAVTNEDVDAFERATHGLKGVAGTFGAAELLRLTGAANTKARTKKVATAFEMAAQIEKIAGGVVASVGQLNRRYATSTSAQNEES